MPRSTTSHWKDSRTGEGSLAPGRTARRWLATLATLALIGVLVAIFWRPSPVIPRLVAVTVRGFDERSLLPPLPYVDEDIAALVDLEESRFMIHADPQGTTADNLLGYMREQLQDAQWVDDDVLVLYLLMHGLTLPTGSGTVPNGGDPPGTTGGADVKAVLADSSFRFDGGVAIEDVLTAADKCQAGTKLVVLDASRIPSLPSEGMFANELARAVLEELEKTEDDQPVYGDDLWVLLTSGMFEIAAVDDDTRRSVFSRAFEDAVRCPEDSGIDANGDEQLSVGELYAAVRRRVNEQSPGQTVLLMRGGAGLVESDDDLAGSPVFVSVRRRVDSDERKHSEDSEETIAQGEDPGGKQQTAASQVAANVSGGQLTNLPKSTTAAAESAAMRTVNDSAAAAAGAVAAQAAGTRATATADAGAQPTTDGTQLATLETPAPAEAPAPAGDTGGPAISEGGAAAPNGQPAAASAESPPEKRPRRPIFEPLDEKLAPEERFRTQLARAWEVNAYLASRDTHGGWSPIDFAPLAWRRSEARLVAWERDFVLAANDEGRKAKLNDVSDELVRLNALAEAMDPVSPGGPISAANARGNELLDAWQQFWPSDEQQTWQEAVRFVEFQSGDPAGTTLGRQMGSSQAAADLVYASGELAAFYDALLACGATDTQSRTFAALLKDYLAQVTTLCEQLRDGAAASVVSQEAREAAERSHRTLQAQVRRLAGLVEAHRTSGGVPPAALIAAHKARASRGGSSSMPPGREEDEPPGSKEARSAVFGTRSFHERSRDRAEIYMLLAGLALLPDLETSRWAAEISVSQSGEDFLDSTRRVGRRLQAAFAAVAEHVADGGDGPLLTAQRARLLDPHTIHSLEASLRQPYFTAPPLPIPERVYIARAKQNSASASPVRLTADRAEGLPLSVRMYGVPAADPRVTFRYDENEMTVLHAGRTIKSGTATPLSALLGANAARRGAENLVELQIVGKPARSGSEPESPLTISLEGQQPRQDDLVIRCIRPLARPFLLAVGSDASALDQTPSGIWSDPLELRPYPNRKTTFPFQLKNLSGAAKTVDVQLFAAQDDLELFRQFWREQDPEMNVSEHLGRLLGQSPVLVGEVKGVQLSGQESKAITFTKEKPPQPPAPEGGAASGSGAPAAPPPAEAAPALDVTRGLIAVVTDGDQKTHFFMEIEPRLPSSFLETDARVVPGGGVEVVQIRVRPRAGEVIPGLADAPLIVQFSEENSVLDGRLQIRDRGEIVSNNAEAQLEFGLRRDETQWRVLLDVGSVVGESEVFYNRAFYLQISDERSGMRVTDLRSAQNTVRIDELSMGADEPTRIRFRGPAELPNAQFSVRTLRGAPAPTIAVGFHVDARNSAFTRFDDRVRLWAGDQLLVERHADREVMAQVVELAADGLVLQTRVEDFQYQWRPEQREAAVPLRLELVLAEGGGTQDQTSVKLDAELPQVERLPQGTLPVSRTGAPQLVVSAFDKLTGITRVEVARNVDPRAPFGEKDQILEAVNVRLTYEAATRTYRWQGDLPAELAKPGETVRLAVRAFDGVGHASEPQITEVALPRQLGPPPAPRGTIVGTASFNGRPEQPIAVELQGPDGLARKTLINAQKGFRFDDLPAGDYTFTAEGEVRLQVAGVKKVTGTASVPQFDPAKTKTRRVTLTLTPEP